MSDWDDYRLILALARSRSMRMAARELGLTHTTVSRRLALAERSRGRIFEKTPGGYEPTKLGETLIALAKEIEDLALAGARHQRAEGQELTGRVTVSLPEPIAQYLLLEDLFECAAAFPGIELKFETSFSFADLDRSEADVVVRGVNEPPPHLVGRRVFANHVTFYADREYLASTPRDQLRWIAPSPDGMWPDWIKQSPYPDVPAALYLDDITARHRALVKGLGLGRGACFMADPEPGLVRLTTDPPVAQQDLWVLTHPDLRNTPRIRAVVDFFYEALKAKQDLVTGEA